MSILINDPDLEQRLDALAKRQSIPVRKTTMATAILRAAVGDGRGGPVDKWRGKSRKFSKVKDAA